MADTNELDLTYYTKLANKSNYGSSRSLSNISYIVVHYTANDGDTDTGNGKYFANNKVGASAHIFVDEDSCTQSVPDNYVAWHCETAGMTFKCSCRNSNSIGVEMCSDKVNGEYVITEQTKLNTVKVVKWLMKKYNVPIENVIRHYDVCGKICPEPWVRKSSEWTDFKNKLAGAIAEKKEEDDEMIETGTVTVNGKDYKITKILKDDKNFICVSDLRNMGFNIGYNADTKNITIDNKVNNIDVVANGKDNSMEAVLLNDYNYVKLRDIEKVTDGAVAIGYEDGKPTINTK